jgi:hypothetical protein
MNGLLLTLCHCPTTGVGDHPNLGKEIARIYILKYLRLSALIFLQNGQYMREWRHEQMLTADTAQSTHECGQRMIHAGGQIINDSPPRTEAKREPVQDDPSRRSEHLACGHTRGEQSCSCIETSAANDS